MEFRRRKICTVSLGNQSNCCIQNSISFASSSVHFFNLTWDSESRSIHYNVRIRPNFGSSTINSWSVSSQSWNNVPKCHGNLLLSAIVLGLSRPQCGSAIWDEWQYFCTCRQALRISEKPIQTLIISSRPIIHLIATRYFARRHHFSDFHRSYCLLSLGRIDGHDLGVNKRHSISSKCDVIARQMSRHFRTSHNIGGPKSSRPPSDLAIW
jgi:hypothetical protein